jgi:hypothetical protein
MEAVIAVFAAHSIVARAAVQVIAANPSNDVVVTRPTRHVRRWEVVEFETSVSPAAPPKTKRGRPLLQSALGRDGLMSDHRCSEYSKYSRLSRGLV